MTDDQIKDIEQFKKELLTELRETFPISSYIDPAVETVRARWIGELANAVATLYVGYQLGSQIENIGNALVRTIDAIGDVARSISRVLDGIADIIEAINHAIEAIGKKVDGSLMRMHMADMLSASLHIQDTLLRLKGLPHDQMNPSVQQELIQLRRYQDSLFDAVIRYVNQEEGMPSPAALIGCAPSIALWAQTYTLHERYKAVSERIPPWQTASQRALAQFIDSVFATYIEMRPQVEGQLEHEFLIPDDGLICDLVNSQFQRTSIPYSEAYLDQIPLDLFSTRADYPFDLSVTVKAGMSVKWRLVRPDNYGQFVDPKKIEAAVMRRAACQEPRRKAHLFLAETSQFETHRAKAAEAMADQPDW